MPVEAADERSGNALGGFVITETSPEGGAYFDPNTRVIMIGADVLKSGNVTDAVTRALENDGTLGTIVHEVAHGIEETNAGRALAKLVTDDADLHDLAITDVLERGYLKEYFAENGKEADLNTVRRGIERLIERENAGDPLTTEEQAALDEYRSEVAAFANQRLLGNKSFIKKLITTEPTTAEKLIGKIREVQENLKARKDPAAKAQLDFVRKAEKLFMQGLSEAGGVIDANGKIHIANREDDELTRENSEKMHVSDAGNAENAAEVVSDENKKSPERGVVRRLAKQRISDAVDKAIANKGKIGERYNQMSISAVPQELATLVNKASNSLIDISNKVVAVNGDDLWHEYDRHSNVKIEQGRQQIAFTPQEMKEAIEAIYSPDVVESVFADKNNPTQRQSFAYAKKSAQGHYIVVEAVGGKQNPNIVPAMILQFSEAKWDKMMSEGKTLGELFYENDAKLRGFLDIEFNKKNRVTAAQFASQEAIANTPHSPRSTIIISNSDQIVNPSAQENSGKVSRSRSTTGEAVTLSKGQLAKLKANYHGEKVFDKPKIVEALMDIECMEHLKPATVNRLVDELWKGFNGRLGASGYQLQAQVVWDTIHTAIIEEAGDYLLDQEYRFKEPVLMKMEMQITNALERIVREARPSKAAQQKAATDKLREQAAYWRDEHTRVVERTKALPKLSYALQRLADMKKGRYVNAAQYQGDTFSVAVKELARMNWRGGLVRDAKIREHFAALAT